MIGKSIATAFVAAVVGFGTLAGTSVPAAADSFNFGVTIGEPHGYYGWRNYERHRDYDRRWDRRARWDRNDYRGPRKVQVCEPVWKVKKYTDEWGRVYKVVRIKETECYWKRRG
jgi:hypothetical protein